MSRKGYRKRAEWQAVERKQQDGLRASAFFHAYELRMDTLVTHPMFEYRVSYRRLLEIQARLLARFLNGEIDEYPVFVTR